MEPRARKPRPGDPLRPTDSDIGGAPAPDVLHMSGSGDADPSQTPQAPRPPQTPEDPERAADIESLPDLAAELAEAKEEAAKNLETARRWQAEFENFRKRQTAVAEDQRLRAGEQVVERLFPVIDDLERAIDHAVGGGDLKHLLAGVEMVNGHLVGVLAKEGVEVIDPFGQEFDPHLHHAVGQREDAEVPEHTVVEVLQKGYRMHGRVLRPAMVVVSTGGPAREAEGQG